MHALIFSRVISIGQIVYYDGQMDDARINVALATTAAMAGAAVANHVRVLSLTKARAVPLLLCQLRPPLSVCGTEALVYGVQDASGAVNGAVCDDTLTGERFTVSARVVINAAGPFCDAVRRCARRARSPAHGYTRTWRDARRPAEQAGRAECCAAHHTQCGRTRYTAAVLLVRAVMDASRLTERTSRLTRCFPRRSAETCGLIVPKTKDGRVVFLLPWLGAAIAGTTDAAAPLSMTPRATAEEVDFILDALSDYLVVKPRRQDVLSAWSGIRPLASDASKGATENLVRDHVLTSDNGLLTITGGKWTTYRRVRSPNCGSDAKCLRMALTPRRRAGPDGARCRGHGRTRGWPECCGSLYDEQHAARGRRRLAPRSLRRAGAGVIGRVSRRRRSRRMHRQAPHARVWRPLARGAQGTRRAACCIAPLYPC